MRFTATARENTQIYTARVIVAHSVAKFMFSKDMKSINQILLCDHFCYSTNVMDNVSYVVSSNHLHQRHIWFCVHGITLFLYKITTNHQITVRYKRKLVAQWCVTPCVSVCLQRKNMANRKNNFWDRIESNNIFTRQKGISHRIHMLHG